MTKHLQAVIARLRAAQVKRSWCHTDYPYPPTAVKEREELISRRMTIGDLHNLSYEACGELRTRKENNRHEVGYTGNSTYGPGREFKVVAYWQFGKGTYPAIWEQTIEKSVKSAKNTEIANPPIRVGYY